MLLNFVWAVQIFSALLLIILILLHSPKGDGIAGIGGASHVFASQKSAEKGLNKYCCCYIYCLHFSFRFWNNKIVM